MDNTATMDTQVRDAFGDLLERHRGIVLKVAGTYCRDPDDRADLAQDIATQAWRAFRSYDDARPFPTWLYRIALNVAISFVRSESRRRRHAVPLDEDLHDVAVPGHDHEGDEQVRLLQRLIESLDPLNRALLLLYLDGNSQREIAEVLGISETNVATKLSRLRQRLRAAHTPK